MLVGTWKAKQVPMPKTNNFADAARAGMYSMFTQGMTVEFNDQGSFKMSMVIGAGSGKYEIQGDTVTLKFESMAPSQPLSFKFKDEKTLELKREFDSDPTVVFEKQP
jgi:hypothetical protein